MTRRVTTDVLALPSMPMVPLPAALDEANLCLFFSVKRTWRGGSCADARGG